MPLPREEQETVVRFEYGCDTCTICTTYPVHARKLMRRGLTPEVSRVPVRWEEVKDRTGRVTRQVVEWDDATWSFEVPADWFRLPTPPRKISEAERRARSERMKARWGKDSDDNNGLPFEC